MALPERWEPLISRYWLGLRTTGDPVGSWPGPQTWRTARYGMSSHESKVLRSSVQKKNKETYDKQQSRSLSSFLSHRIYVFHGLRPGSVLFFCKLLICTELKSTLVELS